MDNRDIKLTVVIPSYNRGEYISQCIESALNQVTDFRFQVIVADDCSTDDTEEVCKKYCKKYSDRFSFFASDQNHGLFSNVLRIYRTMNTEYFTVLDADDYWKDYRFLQEAVDFLDSHKGYAIYAGNTEIIKNGKKMEKYIKTDRHSIVTVSILDFLNNSGCFGHTTASVYRNVILGSRTPQIMIDAEGTLAGESFRGDVDRNVIHIKYGKLYWINKVYGVYRIHGTGIYSSARKEHNYIIEARAELDHSKFFNEKWKMGFYILARDFFDLAREEIQNQKCFDEMSDLDKENYYYIEQALKNYFSRYPVKYEILKKGYKVLLNCLCLCQRVLYKLHII